MNSSSVDSQGSVCGVKAPHLYLFFGDDRDPARASLPERVPPHRPGGALCSVLLHRAEAGQVGAWTALAPFLLRSPDPLLLAPQKIKAGQREFDLTPAANEFEKTLLRWDNRTAGMRK